jgi:hypothetical protein
MTTPHRGEQSTDARRQPPDQGHACTVSTGEHCLCGVTSFVGTTVVVALLYPTLVGVTRPLHLLSSTALLTIAVAIWIGTWFGLELAWEWRAGRLPVDA